MCVQGNNNTELINNSNNETVKATFHKSNNP